MKNIMIDFWIETYTWWWLNLYFAKYKIPEQAGDFEKFVSSFSLNGIKRKQVQQGDSANGTSYQMGQIL